MARVVPGSTVKIVGLRSTLRAFRRFSGELNPEMRAALRKAAEPVAEAARGKEVWEGASINTIGPRVTVAGAAVTQRKRKVTGARPDFGALQMRKAFIPALEENSGEVYAAAEAAIDGLIAGWSGGFSDAAIAGVDSAGGGTTPGGVPSG